MVGSTEVTGRGRWVAHRDITPFTALPHITKPPTKITPLTSLIHTPSTTCSPPHSPPWRRPWRPTNYKMPRPAECSKPTKTRVQRFTRSIQMQAQRKRPLPQGRRATNSRTLDPRTRTLTRPKVRPPRYLNLTRSNPLPVLLELAVDTGGSDVIPTITVHDVEAHPNDVATITQPAQTPPGSIDASPYVIPDWYKVGWRAVGGADSPELQGEAKDAAILSTFLQEQYYGDWYHNAGLVFFVRASLPPCDQNPTDHTTRPSSPLAS